MAVQEQVAELLNRKMDRANFLKSVAIGLVALSGLGGALRLLAPTRSGTAPQGYGSSAYGGSIERR